MVLRLKTYVPPTVPSLPYAPMIAVLPSSLIASDEPNEVMPTVSGAASFCCSIQVVPSLLEPKL